MEIVEYLSGKKKKLQNGKSYFSLKEICTDLNCDFETALKSLVSILEMFKAINYPANKMMFFVRDEFKQIDDVFLTSEALMFLSADIHKSKRILRNTKVWKQIANEIYDSTDKFYAEDRFLLRRKYSKLSVELNEIIATLSYVHLKRLSYCYEEIYSAILNNYYNVSSKQELYKRKNLSKGQNYLDYITRKELNDLCWILENVISFSVENDNFEAILDRARVCSAQASEQFFDKMKRTPCLQPTHADKPKKMLKNLFNMLSYYKLNEIETADKIEK